MNRLWRYLLGASLIIGLSAEAFSAPVTYLFSTTGVSLETRNNLLASGDMRLYADSDVISGQFIYDNAAAVIVDQPSATVYQAVNLLQGSVAGDTFSDPTGLAIMQNDAPFPGGCGDPPAPACQGVQDRTILLADGQIQNLVGFTREDGNAVSFQLVNVAIFWLADSATIDATALPGVLPPAGFNPGGIRLDFAQVGDPTVMHSVFGAGLTVSAVPLPAAGWLFVWAVGVLGLWRRRQPG